MIYRGLAGIVCGSIGEYHATATILATPIIADTQQFQQSIVSHLLYPLSSVIAPYTYSDYKVFVTQLHQPFSSVLNPLRSPYASTRPELRSSPGVDRAQHSPCIVELEPLSSHPAQEHTNQYAYLVACVTSTPAPPCSSVISCSLSHRFCSFSSFKPTRPPTTRSPTPRAPA